MRKKRCLLMGTLALTACGASPQPALERDMNQLKIDIAALKDSLQAVRRSIRFDEIWRDLDKIAFMTPGSDGYSVIRTDLGPMTVSLENIESYANGSRVTLQVGNITSATINGAKATVEWGRVSSDSAADNPTKSREVSFRNPLRSGSWNTISVVLEGVPPTELGFVRIRDFTHTGLRLSQ